jgi:hypothetical protein
MGSGSSRLETRWWEAEAQRKVTTAKNTGKVVVLCSLIPGVDETAMVGRLKERPDLDTLFELHCRYQNLPAEQRANPLDLTVESKANELWRALQMLLEYSESPWDPNWQPPFEGSPSEIAAEFYATVCRVIFQVPFFDFVKYTLGYNIKAHSLVSLLYAVYNVRDGLRTVFQDRPMTRDIYIKVKKVSER